MNQTTAPQDEAAAAEIRKLEAKLAAMQRAFDNLSGDMARQGLDMAGSGGRRPEGNDKHTGWWIVGGLGVLALLALVVFFFANSR